MRNGLVSVIIPVYNTRDTIEKCLDSIINQTYSTIEIIVINDGSKDNAADFIKSKYKKEKRLVFIEQENRGLAGTRNRGLDIAKGKYITFVDSDDFLNKNFIEKILEDYQENKLNGGNFNIVSKDKSKVNCREDANREDMYTDILSKKIGGFVWGYIYEKEIIGDLRFDANLRYMEDAPFLLEYCKKVDGIHFVKDAFYNYTYNAKGLTASKSNIVRNIQYIDASTNQIREKFKDDTSGIVNIRELRFIEAELGKLYQKDEIVEVLKNAEFRNIIENIEINYANKIFWKLYKRMILSSITLTVFYLKIRRILKKIKEGIFK